MSKPVVVFTRPDYWANCESDKLELRHVSIGGGEPVLLRNKKLCGDSVGGVMTDKGARDLVMEFRIRKPDVFLWWAHYTQDGTKDKLGKMVKLLRELRGLAPKAKFLYGNGNQQGMPDFNVEAFKEFIDGILINTRDKREFEMYKSHGIKFVDTLHTFGFDPEKHGPGKAFSKNKNPKYDCFFGGSQTLNIQTGRPSNFYPANQMLGGKYPGSKRRFEYLKKVNDHFNLLVRGKGKWHPIVAHKYLDANEYPTAFGDAKIALGMYHWDLERYYTKRTIYSGASGRLLITFYIPGMEKDFENGKNIVWFKEIESGLSKIDYYLEHDKEREALAKAQREHFIKNHSWVPRLREFEKIVEKIL